MSNDTEDLEQQFAEAVQAEHEAREAYDQLGPRGPLKPGVPTPQVPFNVLQAAQEKLETAEAERKRLEELLAQRPPG